MKLGKMLSVGEVVEHTSEVEPTPVEPTAVEPTPVEPVAVELLDREPQPAAAHTAR